VYVDRRAGVFEIGNGAPVEISGGEFRKVDIVVSGDDDLMAIG
jgi:hypothetical protein